MMMVLHLWVSVPHNFAHHHWISDESAFMSKGTKNDKEQEAPQNLDPGASISLRAPHHRHTANKASRALFWCNLAPSQKSSTLRIEATFL